MPPLPYAMSQFTSPRIPLETLDYIFMELHWLRDRVAAQDHLIQSMSEESTHLRQEVTSRYSHSGPVHHTRGRGADRHHPDHY